MGSNNCLWKAHGKSCIALFCLHHAISDAMDAQSAWIQQWAGHARWCTFCYAWATDCSLQSSSYRLQAQHCGPQAFPGALSWKTLKFTHQGSWFLRCERRGTVKGNNPDSFGLRQASVCITPRQTLFYKYLFNWTYLKIKMILRMYFCSLKIALQLQPWNTFFIYYELGTIRSIFYIWEVLHGPHRASVEENAWENVAGLTVLTAWKEA